MFRPRLIDVRRSGLPMAVGLCATDLFNIAAYVNESQERLMSDPLTPDEGWLGSWVRMAFNVSRSSPSFITPQNVSRVILLDVCKHPVHISNEFYEFMEFGRGYMPTGCPGNSCNQTLRAYERETVVTASPLLAPSLIRIYPVSAGDVGRTVLIQGSDANGQVVRYQDGTTGKSGLGEFVVLGQPFSTTVNTFSEITGIQKPKSIGEFQFFQVNAATGVETALNVMQPNEETSSYRKYFVNGLPQNCCNTTNGVVQVLAMCKLDFVPVEVDTDYLIIASIPALIEESLSIRFGRMDIPDAQQLAASHHATALRLLFGQLDSYLGKERVSISVPLFGSDRLMQSFA